MSVTTAVGWLRHFRGAPLLPGLGVRYVPSVLTPISVLVLGAMALVMVEQHQVTHPADLAPAFVGIVLGLGIVLVALVVWPVVEVRRFRARPYGASRVNRPRPRARPHNR
jgi:hypothetical protein